MKLRITNDRPDEIKVVLEPWANEYTLAPGDSVDFVAQGELPADAFFQVDESIYGTIVYAEWENPLVGVFNAAGEQID